MMKITVLILLTLVLLQACALKQTPPATSGNPASQSHKTHKVDESVPKNGDALALFELLSPAELTLTLKMVGKKKTEKMILKQGLSHQELKVDRWQIVGFEMNGETYKTIRTHNRFDFRMKKKKANYGGTLIVQCPKVSAEHSVQLKKMTFFNRYHFGAGNKLCEMVVGDNFVEVKHAWQAAGSSSKLKLNMGF